MESRKPMFRKERGAISGQAVVLALLVAGIGVVAWLGGRRAERAALIERAVRERTEAPAPPTTREAAMPPSAAEESVPGEERSATLEVAVAPPVPEPTAEPAFLSAREPRAEDPARCLTFEASPNSASAYGATGTAVQLVIRVRNSCATGFPGHSTYFRAVAVSMGGTELAAATGRFSGEIKPYSTAETLVAIEADPTRIRSWRVELR